MRRQLTLLFFVFSCIFFAPITDQLQTYETEILLQLRKHLEYPSQLDTWENYNADFCTSPSTPHLSIKCLGDSVTELKIMGNKIPNGNNIAFNGLSIPNQTLSESFSMDSFVTTLTRLLNLRVLSLVSLGIWGPLPDKIHRLYSLELVDLSSNFLFGSVPSEMSRMARLHTLRMDCNFFNQSLPDWLGSLPNLTVLSFKNNRLKGQFPSSLAKISTLSDVILSHNSLSGKLPDLSALTALHLLDLRENKFNSELPSFPSGITTILLCNNSLSGEIPGEVGKLHKLQYLDMSNNFLRGMLPAELLSLPNISYLNLASNMLSGSLPEVVHCGDALGFVDLSDNTFKGRLPSCLNSTSGRRIVKFSWNCFSGDDKHQHTLSYCKEAFRANKSATGTAIAVLIGSIVGTIIVVFLLAIAFLFFRRRRCTRSAWNPHPAPKVVQDNLPSGTSSHPLSNARVISHATKLGTQGIPSYRVFSLAELQEATNNFDKLAFLGEGSIGKMYQGRLENGHFVAIRSLAMKRKHVSRNLNIRLDLLSKLRHPHLVSLLGHCIVGAEQDDSTVNRVFLVYEFVPNGNYCAYLTENNLENILEWSDRLAILIGVAKAVLFLHTRVIPPTMYNQLKTNNILLDEHRVAKLSDYGMSVLLEESDRPEAKGDVSKSWNMTKLEDDVYNFGFILLESLVGPMERGKGEAFLLNEMRSFGSQDGRQKIVDPVVLTTSSQESLSIVISLTNKCISPDSTSRPSFEDVLWNLQYAAQVQSTADADQKSDGASQS